MIKTMNKMKYIKLTRILQQGITCEAVISHIFQLRIKKILFCTIYKSNRHISKLLQKKMSK